jgi:hypothetical protein
MPKQQIIAGAALIVTDTFGGEGSIVSNLRKGCATRKEADVLESFILALACEGVTFDARFEIALTTTLEHLANDC